MKNRTVVRQFKEVPQGFVSTAPLCPGFGKEETLSPRRYGALMNMARQGLFPSFKVMNHAGDRTGQVYIPENWRELDPVKNHQFFRAAPVFIPEPTFEPITEVSDSISEVSLTQQPTQQAVQAMSVLAESLMIQKALLSTMQRLEQLWAPAPTAAPQQGSQG